MIDPRELGLSEHEAETLQAWKSRYPRVDLRGSHDFAPFELIKPTSDHIKKLSNDLYASVDDAIRRRGWLTVPNPQGSYLINQIEGNSPNALLLLQSRETGVPRGNVIARVQLHPLEDHPGNGYGQRPTGDYCHFLERFASEEITATGFAQVCEPEDSVLRRVSEVTSLGPDEKTWTFITHPVVKGFTFGVERSITAGVKLPTAFALYFELA